MQRRLIITDADRARLRGERTLAELLPAQTEEAPPPSFTWRRQDIAGIICGLFLAFALIVWIGRVVPERAERPAPTLPAPTAARPAVVATRAPTLTAVPTPTAEPLPSPTPVIIIQQAPPPPPVQCYTVSEQVYDARGYPVGSVEGYSCVSQEEAQANADAQAEQVRAAHP